MLLNEERARHWIVKCKSCTANARGGRLSPLTIDEGCTRVNTFRDGSVALWRVSEIDIGVIRRRETHELAQQDVANGHKIRHIHVSRSDIEALR
jgi:hypothetical protein